MDRKMIQQYFDTFCDENNINDLSYTYMYYLLYDVMNKTKNSFVVNDNDAILPFYDRNGKRYFPFLPLVKFNVKNNVDKYNSILKKFISEHGIKKIEYVPIELYSEIKLKLTKSGNRYMYKTSDYDDLIGHKFKSVRRYYNKFKEGKNLNIRLATVNDISQIDTLFSDWKHYSKDRLFRIFDTTGNKNLINSIGKDINVKRFDYVLTNNDIVEGYICLYEPYNNVISKPSTLGIFTIKCRHFTDVNEGITDYFFIECMRLANKLGYEYVNHGSDISQKGLREYKMKMSPHEITNGYMYID